MKYFITALILFIGIKTFAQLPVDYGDETRRVYWFDITVKKVKDPQTQISSYKVFRMGTRIQYGSAIEYDRYLWNGLSNGSRIAIGPFNSIEQAERANKIYDLTNARQDSALMSENTTYYWYLVTLNQSKRLRSYQFERIPARVVSGNYSDFIDLMDASLPVNKLIIGLFEDVPEAENSKRVFRLEE
ncbi:MAG: hypothetical protein JXR68_11465 [Bacteroidales bacterium]|nr:hypothetical protein [Bacteroidales bacterium]